MKDKLLAIGIILLLPLYWYFFWQVKEPPKEPASFNDLFLSAEVRGAYEQELIISGNCLMAVSPPVLSEIDVLASKITWCESGQDNSARGKAGEIGIAQFLPSSWKYFNDLRGTDLDIYNEAHQIDMLKWCLENGLGKNWSCFSKI